MSAYRNAAGLSQGIAAIHFRDGASVFKDIAVGRYRDASNTLRVFFETIAASASPPSLNGYGNTGGPVDITMSSDCTCTVVGGAAPFTYLWTRTDAGSDSWTITTATSAITAFIALAITSGSFATFICTVTDDTGAIAVSNEVSARAINLGGGL